MGFTSRFDQEKDDMSEQINEKVEKINRKVEKVMRKFDDRWNSPEIQERINKKVEIALKRSKRTTERAQRSAEAARRRAERHSPRDFAHFRNVDDSFEPVSSDERLAVLRMLQEKKISAQEAEKLLAALREFEA